MMNALHLLWIVPVSVIVGGGAGFLAGNIFVYTLGARKPKKKK